MMNKTFNLTSTFKSEPQDDGSIMVRGMASTNAFDRAGDSISAEAWTKGGLGNFEKNPIILFNHDYNKPIGRATKVTPTADGLHMEAKISKHAECADLIKDGVLGAFSVGFKVKDADYLEETDGLMIKDAELFEVSVVTVPCNQAATFSLSKSFDSEQDYEDFKKTFKSEEDSSLMETDMSEETKTPEIDLDAFAKKVAEETAAKIAIRQAEEKAAAEAEVKAAEEAEVQKAAEEAEAQKAAVEQQEKVESSIRTGIESGTEKLAEDLRKEFQAEQANTAEILEKYKAELEEKSAELAAMQNSKRQFSDRSQPGDLSQGGREILEAKILGNLTRKGWDTDFASNVINKYGAGVASASNIAPLLDIETATQFERELLLEMKVAGAFREIAVNSTKTVLPLMPDSVAATFGSGSQTDETNSPADLQGNANGTAQGAATFNALQKTITAARMTSTSYITNDTEESTLVALLPMIREGMVRAHARAMDQMCISGHSGAAGAAASGLIGAGGFSNAQIVSGTATAGITQSGAGADSLIGQDVLRMRSQMKKYGLNPADLLLIVSYTAYNDLLSDVNFQDITEVGTDLAIKRTGVVGSIFAIPVVVSDDAGLAVDKTVATAIEPCAVLANVPNYIIPRMKGVSLETEYQVGNQRTAIVASQSVGFEELFAGDAATVGLPVAMMKYANG